MGRELHMMCVCVIQSFDMLYLFIVRQSTCWLVCIFAQSTIGFLLMCECRGGAERRRRCEASWAGLP